MPTDIAQPSGHTHKSAISKFREVIGEFQFNSIQFLRSQIEIDHVWSTTNCRKLIESKVQVPQNTSLSLSYLVHVWITPPLCEPLQLLSSTLKDLKLVFFFSFLCINQVQNLSREKCTKVMDLECTGGVHFRIPTLWPMFRQVTV